MLLLTAKDADVQCRTAVNADLQLYQQPCTSNANLQLTALKRCARFDFVTNSKFDGCGDGATWIMARYWDAANVLQYAWTRASVNGEARVDYCPSGYCPGAGLCPCRHARAEQTQRGQGGGHGVECMALASGR